MSSSKEGGGKRSLTLGETAHPFSEWAYLSRHPTISVSPWPSPSHRSVTVTLGAHNIQKKEDTWQRLEVIKQFPYPKYDPIGLQDIMLLKVQILLPLLHSMFSRLPSPLSVLQGFSFRSHYPHTFPTCLSPAPLSSASATGSHVEQLPCPSLVASTRPQAHFHH